MQSAKRHRTRAYIWETPAGKSPGEIRRYFLQLQGQSPGSRVTAPRGEKQKASKQIETCVSPCSRAEPERSTDNYGSPHRGTMASPQPSEPLLDQDIRSLLQALPTRTDIEALILKLEETHRRDIQEVRGEVSTLAERVSTGETSVALLADRVAALEQARDSQKDAAIALQLHLEDMEDRTCGSGGSRKRHRRRISGRQYVEFSERYWRNLTLRSNLIEYTELWAPGLTTQADPAT